MLKNKLVCYLLSMTACLCLCGCQKQEETKFEALIAPEKANYDTKQVEKSDYLETSQGSVSIEFPNALKLSWDTEGATVKEVLVEKGQEVKAGDVLMSFYVEVDKIALEELEIQLLRKQEDYARKKDVMEVQLKEAEEEAEEIVNMTLSERRQELENARKELEASREGVLEEARKEGEQILADVRNEAEELRQRLDEEVENYRKEKEAELKEWIKEAQQMAQATLEEKTRDALQLYADTVHKTEEMVNLIVAIYEQQMEVVQQDRKDITAIVEKLERQGTAKGLQRSR